LCLEASRVNCQEVIVDHNCGVHLDSYADEARDAGRGLKIGATGKGCAEAIIHKIKDRGVGAPLLLKERWPLDWGPPAWRDVAELLTDAYHDQKRVMLE